MMPHADQVAEVLPEEPGEEAQRQEDGGDDGQLLHHDVEAVRHRRQVRVHDAAEQVPVVVDQVGHADQVVVEVAEVACRLVGHAGHVGDARVDAGDHVALGRHDLAHVHQRALHLEELAELRLGRRLEDVVLQLVDLVVEVGEDGEEAVDQRADDEVHDDELGRGHRAGGWRSSRSRTRARAGHSPRCTVTT